MLIQIGLSLFTKRTHKMKQRKRRQIRRGREERFERIERKSQCVEDVNGIPDSILRSLQRNIRSALRAAALHRERHRRCQCTRHLVDGRRRTERGEAEGRAAQDERALEGDRAEKRRCEERKTRREGSTHTACLAE